MKGMKISLKKEKSHIYFISIKFKMTLQENGTYLVLYHNIV